jgi:hypothetical protein
MTDFLNGDAIPFVLGFGTGMIGALILALSWIGSIERSVTEALTRIEKVVGLQSIEKAHLMVSLSRNRNGV